MKNHFKQNDLIYVHLNKASHYVISSGVTMKEFMKFIPKSQNLLLLSHPYDESNYDPYTKFQIVNEQTIPSFIRDHVAYRGTISWLDFEDEEMLKHLNAEEIAELLYLNHMKKHIRMPFYRQLNNRYAYITQEDGWYSKTFYRYLDDFYQMLGATVADKMSERKEKNFLGLKKKKEFPVVPLDILLAFEEGMREGMLISVEKITHSRMQFEIPVWFLGDMYHMDEMYEKYEHIKHTPPDGKIVYELKNKIWKALIR